VDKIADAAPSQSEAEVPTDLLAGLLMELAKAPSATTREPMSVPLKIYAVMAVTSLATFATLTTGYQLFFAHGVFA
jgi:hypothetical protein